MTRAAPENILASWLPVKPIRKIASTIFSANRGPRFGFLSDDFIDDFVIDKKSIVFHPHPASPVKGEGLRAGGKMGLIFI